jgi:hypothetical protein
MIADPGSLITSLASGQSNVRRQAAAEIFRQGSELLAPILRDCLADSNLSRCFVLQQSRPQITVGVAVQPERFDQIHQANGSPGLAAVPPDQDAKEFELEFPGDVRIDVLTTRDRNGRGALARYLQRFGEGIQQIEILVNDVDRATQLLGALFGIQPVYPATRAGANGSRVNFFLIALPAGGRVLVELVQT